MDCHGHVIKLCMCDYMMDISYQVVYNSVYLYPFISVTLLVQETTEASFMHRETVHTTGVAT